MRLTPDDIIYWQSGFFKINSTIATTWILMLFLVVFSKLITRNISPDSKRSRFQNLLEMIVITIRNQVGEIGIRKPDQYLPFLGTLFIFIAFSNICTIFPGYEPPTGSLSTTAALALAVFLGVPFYGILNTGISHFLKSYVEPVFIMLPFNIISEISRTLALAIRLFGNMMSGTMIISILLTITPLFFPIVMNILGLLTGIVQAYIFSILAAVYIAAATQHAPHKNQKKTKNLLKQQEDVKV